MKASLRKAISLFNLFEQLSIIWAILCIKLKQKIPTKAAVIFTNCDSYVRLIEQEVSFTNAGKNLFKATLVINKNQVSVFLRKNSSDRRVLESVLINEEYKIATDKLLNDGQEHEKVIIDAGGNIGLTTIYLHSFYPKARFLVIEPDENNFGILKMNLQENNITSASLFKNALWTSDENLIMDNSFRDGKEWSLTVEKINNEAVHKKKAVIQGISLKEICAVAKIQHIDLLKIDIEGGERFLFNDEGFMHVIKNMASNLVIEIHDEFEIRSGIYSSMSLLGFIMQEDKYITYFSKV